MFSNFYELSLEKKKDQVAVVKRPDYKSANTPIDK
jgi:hypothetical protein